MRPGISRLEPLDPRHPRVPCVYESWKATRGSSKQPSTFFVTVTVAEIGARFSSSSSVWSNQSLSGLVEGVAEEHPSRRNLVLQLLAALLARHRRAASRSSSSARPIASTSVCSAAAAVALAAAKSAAAARRPARADRRRGRNLRGGARRRERDECERPDDERGERANPSRAARRAAAAGDRARRILLDARNVPLDVGEELVVGAARRPARFTHRVSRRRRRACDHVRSRQQLLDEWRPRCC